MLNTDKTTCTLFTPDPAEYYISLHLQTDNTTLPMNTYPHILGVTLYIQHTTACGKQKEMLISTYNFTHDTNK